MCSLFCLTESPCVANEYLKRMERGDNLFPFLVETALSTMLPTSLVLITPLVVTESSTVNGC